MNDNFCSSSKTTYCSILDIPNEILVKIISYFNPRKRLVLANTCSRFNDLVFQDEELMRNLDFSKNGRFLRVRDVQRFFTDEKSRDLVRKVNIENVNCMRDGKRLNFSIGRALNLVDLNVHGVDFRDIKELGSFLEPLMNLKKLSIDWPKCSAEENDVRICRKILQKPLIKLSFFSVKIFVYSVEFLPNIKLCKEIEELNIITTESHRHMRRISWDLEPSKLRNLKIVKVRGPQAMQMKKHLVNVLPDPQEWTDFQLIDISREPGFYFEKNVEVCKELRATTLSNSVPYQRENPPHYDIGWFLISEYLLENVIRITHEDVPKTFCCLSTTLEPLKQDREPCLLKIDEAKRLLRDPRHQISFLYFKHSIENNCDAHLVASAFPNLTELVLCDVIESKQDTVMSTQRKKKHLRRLRRRGTSSTEGDDDLTYPDPSSFEMLVDNTPFLRDLTIYAENDFDEEFSHWDLNSLSLISRWKNLRTLRIALVPIRDGKFLIEIGKKCEKLERVVLRYLGNEDSTCCYTNDLSQMLKNCKNLKEFSIQENYIENIPEIFASLFNNSKLKKFTLISSDRRNKLYDPKELISSVEKLVHSCGKLNTFVFIVEPLFQGDSNELTTALKRIRERLNRPNFQFQTIGNNQHSRNGGSKQTESEIVFQDASPFFFSSILHDGFDFK